MLIPVRCFSCGKVTGNKYERYCLYVSEGMSECEALDKLGLVRYCCRRMILNHTNLIDKMLAFEASRPPPDVYTQVVPRPTEREHSNFFIAR